MNKVYTRIQWKNYPSLETPLNETNLNKLDYATNEIDNRVVNLDSTKVSSDSIQNNIKSWTMDETTGVITITKYNNETITFDLNIEKIPVSFELSDDGILTMTTEDGTTFTANIGSMIPVLTFNNSSTINVNVSGEGINKTYTFSIKEHCIGADQLQNDYLADITTQANNARASATTSQNKATLSESWAVGGTNTRESEDTNNAKYYSEQASATVENKLDKQFTGEGVSNKTLVTDENGNIVLAESSTGNLNIVEKDYDVWNNLPDEQKLDETILYSLNEVPEEVPIVVDDTPTADSNNLVTSGGVYSALSECGKTYLGICNDSGDTVTKTVTIEGFELKPGVRILVRFNGAAPTKDNYSDKLTLNVNNTGAFWITIGNDQFDYARATGGEYNPFCRHNWCEFIYTPVPEYSATYWVLINHDSRYNYNLATNLTLNEGLTGSGSTVDTDLPYGTTAKASFQQLLNNDYALNTMVQNKTTVFNISGGSLPIASAIRAQYNDMPDGIIFNGVISYLSGRVAAYTGYKSGDYGAFLVFSYFNDSIMYRNYGGEWSVKQI